MYQLHISVQGKKNGLKHYSHSNLDIKKAKRYESDILK